MNKKLTLICAVSLFGGCVSVVEDESISSPSITASMTTDGTEVSIVAIVEKARVVRWEAVMVTTDLTFRHYDVVGPIAPWASVVLNNVATLGPNRRRYSGSFIIPECASRVSGRVNARVVLPEPLEQPLPSEARLTPVQIGPVTAGSTDPTAGSEADSLLGLRIANPASFVNGRFLPVNGDIPFEVLLGCTRPVETLAEIAVRDARCSSIPIVLPPAPLPIVPATAFPTTVTIPAGQLQSSFTLTLGSANSLPTPPLPPVGAVDLCVIDVSSGFRSNKFSACIAAARIADPRRRFQCEGLARTAIN